jgi:hypothetical protein
MKNNLLLVLVLLSSFCYAQEIKSLPEIRAFLDENKPKGIKVLEDGTIVMPGLPNSFKEVPSFPRSIPVEPQAKYLQTLPNGNMEFALPQDNMPCIVPNENLSVAIPNVSGKPTLPYSYKGPGAIPNPSVPILINPLVKPKKK